jgi:arylsulfatase B
MREDMEASTRGMGEYATRLFTNEAIKVVAEHNTSQPLFLYLSHLGLHVGNSYRPLQAPQETIDLFQVIDDPDRRIYAGKFFINFVGF